MEEFTVSLEKEGNAICYRMGGYLSEAAKLPLLEVAPVIKINLGKIIGLNSYGVRWWCRWVKPIPTTTKIILIECPMVFVKSFNTVAGFLIPNMEVASFYVPFYSPVDETRKDVLYIKGEHYNGSELKHPMVLGNNANPLEMDTAANYFKFLERQS